jgi:tetratricopeptide (TPR) repeat protein
MRQLPSVIRLLLLPALFLVLPFAALPTNHIQVLNFRTQEPGKGSAETLTEATRLSLTVVKLFNEGKYDEALALGKRALALREAALGPDHEAVQGALLNLAEIYTALKKYGEAQKVVERLVKTHETKIGPEDAGLAILLEKLAFLAYAQRDFKKTEAAYKRALVIREKAFGPDQAEFATSLFLLAEFYRYTGKGEEAQPLYERAALLRKKLFGRENPEYLRTKERYLCLAYETGEANREKKLKDFEEKLGDTSSKSSTVEGGVLNGRALSLPKPSYSEEARRVRARGTVIIKVTIDELGNVIEAMDMCGADPLLVKPSLQAARVARFTPTKLFGQPVKVTGVITYNFVVQ